MGLSIVIWLGNDSVKANVDEDGLTEAFVQISMIWCSLLFGLMVERIELPSLSKPKSK